MHGMILGMRLVPTLCATLVLAGCLHPGTPAVRASPVASAPAPGSFRLAGADGNDAVAVEVSAALAARGWRPAGEGAAANYLVLASYGDRPGQVGAFVPAPGGGAPEWVAERIPRRPWTVLKRGRRVLSLVALDAASGRELRRAQASLDYWRGSDPEAVRRLAAGAAAALTSEPAPPGTAGG
jgi:hypothetical protein